MKNQNATPSTTGARSSRRRGTRRRAMPISQVNAKPMANPTGRDEPSVTAARQSAPAIAGTSTRRGRGSRHQAMSRPAGPVAWRARNPSQRRARSAGYRPVTAGSGASRGGGVGRSP
ncbi:hypothetical protein Q5530_11420 [Saccharothrix sp. BKS2]|uniref:hypothetical protein n=1 Tax=Saccharothrix sp. BKS2 TaxID=3064400 RepID=UPI0039EB6725